MKLKILRIEKIKIPLFLLATFFLTSAFSSNVNYNELYQNFLSARSYQNIQQLESIIQTLEKYIPTVENPHVFDFKILLAEAYLEAGNLARNHKKKREYLEVSLKLSEEVIKNQSTNGKAYFIAALATSQIIEFVNVFQKLVLLQQFDKYMEKALENLQDDLYIGLANMGLGMRYMAPPWPLNDYEKSEMYFKEAQKYIGNYSELYLNWGYLYLKMNNRTKALETFRKVLTLEPNELFLKAHERNAIIAREEIKKLEK